MYARLHRQRYVSSTTSFIQNKQFLQLDHDFLSLLYILDLFSSNFNLYALLACIVVRRFCVKKLLFTRWGFHWPAIKGKIRIIRWVSCRRIPPKSAFLSIRQYFIQKKVFIMLLPRWTLQLSLTLIDAVWDKTLMQK